MGENMKVAPIDIAHKSFNRKMMGLDPQEVTDFLRQISDEMESLIRDRNNLREQMREKDLQIIEFRERDELLKSTITTATRMSEKLQADAEREARLIISDAKQQGEMIIRDARDSLKKIFSEITELKKIRMQYENNLRALVQSHLTMMDQGQKVMPDPEILQAMSIATPGVVPANNTFTGAPAPTGYSNSAAGYSNAPAGYPNAGNGYPNAATTFGTANTNTGVTTSTAHAPTAPLAGNANNTGANAGQQGLFNRGELDAIKQNVTDAVARSIRNIDL
jgi:cell division initiation protein